MKNRIYGITAELLIWWAISRAASQCLINECCKHCAIPETWRTAETVLQNVRRITAQTSLLINIFNKVYTRVVNNWHKNIMDALLCEKQNCF